MRRTRETGKLIAENLIIALLYMAVGQLSLLHSFLDSNIATVWPAGGIALAAILLRGYRILGGVFVGAVLVSFPFTNPTIIGLSFAAAVANCIGPITVVFLVDKMIEDRELLYRRVRNLVLLLAVLLPLGSLVNAVILVASFYFLGFLSAESLRIAFLTFWAGIYQGFLIVGSLLLVWSRRPHIEVPSRAVMEGSVLLVLLVVTSVFVFQSAYPFVYAPIILLIWAAMRFQMHGATLGATIVSGIAIGITSAGYGPFIVEGPGPMQINDSLLLLQVYIAFVTGSALLVAATDIERDDVQLAQAQVQGDLNAAHDIQMNMVPLTFPAFPDRNEFDIYATLRPAKEVGGDFYDFFLIDDDHLCFCVGDVSGKGVTAALFMAVTRTVIRACAADDPSSSRIVTRANNELSADNPTRMFVSLFLGVLDVRTGDCVYTNAGHNPPCLMRSDDMVRLRQRHGPVAGAMDGLTYDEDRIRLGINDRLVVYTDGVNEAMNPDDELLGDRVEAVLRNVGSVGVKEVADSIVNWVHKFEAGSGQSDDVTVLVLRFDAESSTGQFRRTVIFKNDLSELGRVIECVDNFCLENGIDVAVGHKLHVVVDDLIVNVISYAYEDGGSHDIELSVELADGSLSAFLVDDGVPFDPLAREVIDKNASVEAREIRGFGIELIRNLPDRVHYERKGDRNVMTVTFDLAPTSRRDVRPDSRYSDVPEL